MAKFSEKNRLQAQRLKRYRKTIPSWHMKSHRQGRTACVRKTEPCKRIWQMPSALAAYMDTPSEKLTIRLSFSRNRHNVFWHLFTCWHKKKQEKQSPSETKVPFPIEQFFSGIVFYCCPQKMETIPVIDKISTNYDVLSKTGLTFQRFHYHHNP